MKDKEILYVQDDELAKELKAHNMNLLWLREFVMLRTAGYNHGAIAKHTGTCRETVSRYFDKLQILYVTKRDFFICLMFRIWGGCKLGGKIGNV